MTDLKKQLRPMEQVDAPDLWEDIERRRPAPQPEGQESGLRRAGTIVLAFLVAGSAFVFAVSRLGGEGTRRLGGQETVTRYRFDAPPQAIAVGEGAAWVHVGAGDAGGTAGLWRIDAASGDRQPIDVPGGDWPGVGGGSAWLLCNSAACDGGAAIQLDPATGAVVRTIDLPGRGNQIAGTTDGVWVTTEAGPVFVDSDGGVFSWFGHKEYDLIGSDGASLWVSETGGLVKIDPSNGDEVLRVPFPDVCTMEVAEGTVWVASCDGGMHAGGDGDELMGIDAVSGDILFREPIADNGQMRFFDGVLWLAERSADGPIRIVGLDPRTGALTGSSVSVTRDPSHFAISGFWGPHVFFAVGEGSLWVTDFGAAEVIRISGPFPQGTGDPVPKPVPTSTEPAPDRNTHEDPDNAFSVQIPPGWQQADRPLTHLIDPVEIFSAGTFAMRPGGSCPQFPTNAVADMGSHDAFVTILERKRLDPTLAQGPPRPASFGPADGSGNSEVDQCLEAPKVFFDRWIAFSDQGREFYVFVAMGSEVSDQVRAETWAMLDSLAFDPLPAFSNVTTWTTSMVSVGSPVVVSDANGRRWVLVEVDSVPAGFQAEGPVPLCDDGSAGDVEIVGDHQTIQLTCPDGLRASWFGEGSPWDGNPPGYREELGTMPLGAAADGTLLKATP
jgi:hypothetical protein